MPVAMWFSLVTKPLEVTLFNRSAVRQRIKEVRILFRRAVLAEITVQYKGRCMKERESDVR